MPTTESGYVSLDTTNGFRSVYNATTEPAANGGGNEGSSVMKSVKRVIGQAMGGNSSSSPPLIGDAHR